MIRDSGAERKKTIVLNKEQREAVEHEKGPLLIIAGAGTGKTTVITERIKRLIKEGKVSPKNILALTFTDKASQEMEERVDKALPLGYFDLWVLTFHGFCDRLLRNEALQIGLDPGFKLMTPAAAFALVKEHWWEFEIDYFRPSGNPYKFIEVMLAHFSRLKDEDINPSDYITWVNAKCQMPNVKQIPNLKFKNLKKTSLLYDKEELQQYKELAGAYKKYEELKVKEGVMDFSDLISQALRLFRERNSVLKRYRERFQHILVDEFQDTNYAQNELVMLLAGKEGDITVVADDDQAIYRWRGAAISNVIQFRKHFPKAKIVTLTKNYRSSQEILDRAYDLIQNNNPDRLEVKEGIHKRLTGRPGKEEAKIVLIQSERGEDEAEAVVKEIERLKKNYAWKDMAILVRANNHAEFFVRALKRNNFPFQFLGPGKLLKEEEILELAAYLKVLVNFEDDASLYKILSSEIIGLEARDLVNLMVFKKKYNLSLFEALEETIEKKMKQQAIAGQMVNFRMRPGSDVYDKIKKFVEMARRHMELIPRESGGQILYYFLEETGYLSKIADFQTEREEKRALNISKFFEKLRQFESQREKTDVYSTVDWLELLMGFGEGPEAAATDWTEENKVNILTLHSAKGLEFSVVFLVNLAVDRFPTRERREGIPIPEELIKEVLPEGDYHLQEERRLFYVGMTRAKERLYLTAADYYGEGKRLRKLSPFVVEALGESVVKPRRAEAKGESQLTLFDWGTGEEVGEKDSGQKIEHKVNFLSFSQIEAFRICPLHYKLRYILKVPTLPSAPLSFGTSIHAALNSFYRVIMDGGRPGENELLKTLESKWEKLGYASKGHEEEAYEKAKRYLIDYLKTGREKEEKPIMLEEFVNFRVGEGLKMGGRVDRVDCWGENGIEIVDYKTGATVPSQKEIDRDLQMSIYALAATRIPQPPFGVSPEKVKLSFYFFEEQKWISTTRSAEQLKQAEQEILEWVEKIEGSDFPCSGHFFCRDCEYKQFCAVDNRV